MSPDIDKIYHKYENEYNKRRVKETLNWIETNCKFYEGILRFREWESV